MENSANRLSPRSHTKGLGTRLDSNTKTLKKEKSMRQGKGCGRGQEWPNKDVIFDVRQLAHEP